MISPIVTLTTDFGHKSGFVGIMKGVILGIAPETRIVDLSHGIAPQDILEAQFLLQRAEPFFPPDTIHVAVVDPGVGSSRRPIIVQTERCVFVGPDNGIFTPWLDGAEIRHLNRREYFNPKVSSTFHGRDIFAPVAAYLARGIKPQDLGSVITDPFRKSPPQPQVKTGEIIGEIIHIDDFGNLITNIAAEDLAGFRNPIIRIGRKAIKGPVNSYSDVKSGTLCALVGSHGRLEIAVSMGNASQSLGVKHGQKVIVKLS